MRSAGILTCTTALLVAALFCGPAAAADDGSYIIGPNDVLTVNVYGQPQLSGKYPVEGDGTFSFPLLGRIKAGGRTLATVEAEVRDRLARGYLNNPQVTVSLDQYKSQQVFVLGEVKQPGAIPLSGQMTLLEALARAGSTTDNAGQEAVIVHQPPPGNAQATDPVQASTGSSNRPADSIRVDLRRLESGSINENVVLRPGDTVVVPRAQTIFVSGYVKTPGEYPLRQGLTVRQAVALAGGATERGSMGRIQIIRHIGGKEVKQNAQPSDPVQPSDTILVRGKFF